MTGSCMGVDVPASSLQEGIGRKCEHGFCGATEFMRLVGSSEALRTKPAPDVSTLQTNRDARGDWTVRFSRSSRPPRTVPPSLIAARAGRTRAGSACPAINHAWRAERDVGWAGHPHHVPAERGSGWAGRPHHVPAERGSGWGSRPLHVPAGHGAGWAGRPLDAVT